MKDAQQQTRRARLIAAALATVVVLGGATTALCAEPTALKVRIGYATALHGEIAKALGETDIGRKHGLAIETIFFQYGPPQIEALVSKTIDVSFTSLVPTATYLAKQPGAVTVIASVGTSSHGLVVPADSPLRSLDDFKGKRIAVAFGTDSHVDLLGALKALGLVAGSDVTLLNVPPNEQPAALEQKLADGVVLRQPQLHKFLQRGAREIQRWPHHLWVIARSEYLGSNPDARRKLTDAITDAVAFVASDPRQAAAWFAEDLRLDPALVQTIAEQNPLLASARTKAGASVTVSPELKAFAAKRARELADFGLAKQVATFVY
jgi:ABC-type nitrate/sulfonate/bicarbonate transport system substrate-binding protein